MCNPYFNIIELPLRRATGKYKISHVINYGTYGIVLDVKDDNLALKINYVTDGWRGLYSWKETSILRMIDHDNIIRLVDYEIVKDNEISIHDIPDDRMEHIEKWPKNIEYDGTHKDWVYYLMEKGGDNLEDLILKEYNADVINETRKESDELIEAYPVSKDIESIIEHILDGLRHLHYNLGICHLDMKANNVIKFDCKSTSVYKICDFGFSRPIGNNEHCGFNIMHPIYRPPELLYSIDDSVRPQLDIWSLGIIWLELDEPTVFMDLNNLESHLKKYNEEHDVKINIGKIDDEKNQMYNILCFDNIMELDIDYISKGRNNIIPDIIKVYRWADRSGLIKKISVSHNSRMNNMLQIRPENRIWSQIPQDLSKSDFTMNNEHIIYISDISPFTVKDSGNNIIYAHYLYNYIGYHDEFYKYLKDNIPEFNDVHLRMVSWYISEKYNCVLKGPTCIKDISEDNMDIIEKMEYYISQYTNMKLPTHMIYHYMNEYVRPNDKIRTVYMMLLLKPGIYSLNKLGPIFDELNRDRNNKLPTNALSHMITNMISGKPVNRRYLSYKSNFYKLVKPAMIKSKGHREIFKDILGEAVRPSEKE